MAEDPRDLIEVSNRCAIEKSDVLPEWYVGVSPKTGGRCEGERDDFVRLAKAILAADRKWRKQETKR